MAEILGAGALLVQMKLKPIRTAGSVRSCAISAAFDGQTTEAAQMLEPSCHYHSFSVPLHSFLWHGMRHLVTTKLGKLRVKPHIARLDLAHIPFHDPQAGYDQASCREEMLEALETSWAHIECLG